MIQVKAPDGSTVNFPDGTPPATMKAAMAKKYGGPDSRAPGPKSAGGLPVIGDFVDSLAESWDSAKAGYKQTQERARKVVDGRGLTIGDHAAGLVSGPQALLTAVGALPTAASAAITRPLSRSIANLPLQGYQPGTTRKLSNADEAKQLEGDFNTALMGLAPNRGLPKFAPNFAVKPPPRTSAIPRTEARAGAYVEKLAATAKPGALSPTARPRTAAEAIGKSGEIAVGALARRTGETGDALQGVVAERQLTRPTRMLEDVADAAGVSPAAAGGDIKALVAAGRERAAPLYDEAYAAGAIDTPELRSLTQRPSLRKAMSRAMRIAAEEGRNPAEIGFEIRSTPGEHQMVPVKVREKVPGGGTIEKTVMQPGQRAMHDEMVELQNPTAQTWDYVKRGIDDVLNGYRDTTTGKLNLDEEGRAIVGTLKQMRAELINANPTYGKALETAGDYMSADQAFKDGGKLLFNSNFTERQFADKLAGLSPSEIEAFKGGIANKFFDMAQNGRLDPKVLKTPRVRAKLTQALGPEKADRLILAAEEEASMLAFERRRAPDANSVTQEMKAAMDEQDGAAGVLESVARQGPLGALKSAVGGQVEKAAATMRTGGLDQAARDEAGRLLMMPPEELDAYLKSLSKRREASRFVMPRVPKVGVLTEGLPSLGPRPSRRKP